MKKFALILMFSQLCTVGFAQSYGNDEVSRYQNNGFCYDVLLGADIEWDNGSRRARSIKCQSTLSISQGSGHFPYPVKLTLNIVGSRYRFGNGTQTLILTGTVYENGLRWSRGTTSDASWDNRSFEISGQYYGRSALFSVY